LTDVFQRPISKSKSCEPSRAFALSAAGRFGDAVDIGDVFVLLGETTFVSVMTQFVSQVLPPSAEYATSSRRLSGPSGT